MALLISLAAAANAHADGGDFTIDFAAAAPLTYDHMSGGGAYNVGTIGRDQDVVESLNGGDFVCGDIVTFVPQIRVDPGATGMQTATLEFEFDSLPPSGVGYSTVSGVAINYGSVQNGAGPGGVDSGIDDDGGSNVSADTVVPGSTLTLSFTVDDLEAGEKVVVRIDLELGCGSGPTSGNVQANISDAYANGHPDDRINVGTMTVPLKKPGDVDPGGNVVASKSATATWVQKYDWTLSKSVTPHLIKLFRGDTGKAKYTLEATATPVDVYAVAGMITVRNQTETKQTISEIEDVINPEGVQATVSCNGSTSPFAPPIELDPDETLTCAYEAELALPADGLNTATITYSDGASGARTAVATAPVIFPAVAALENNSATLSDTNPGFAQETLSVVNPRLRPRTWVRMYEEQFACDEDGGDNVNTATLEPEASAPIEKQTTVRVRCFELDVGKTARPFLGQRYVWSIEKVASHDQIVLARKKDADAKKGESLKLRRFAKEATVKYLVTVNAMLDPALRPGVTGRITITNPAAAMRPARILDVTDVVSPDIAADVSCQPAIPTTIASGGSLTCTYVVDDLPDRVSRTNTAFAELRNVDVDVDGTSTPSGTSTSFASRSVGFTFDSAPSVAIDETATVKDSKVGELGHAAASDAPVSFMYSLVIKPGEHGAPLCGEGTIDNTAKVTADDTGAMSTASVSIPITVLCFVHFGSGDKKGDDAKVGDDPAATTSSDPSTLKAKDPGVSTDRSGLIDGVENESFDPLVTNVVCAGGKAYAGKRGGKRDPLWKKFGPKKQRTALFKSGKSYWATLRVRSSNPYWRLANGYVRARLNLLSGVPISAKAAVALKRAERLLSMHKPRAMKSKRAAKARKIRSVASRTAKQLSRYNATAKRLKVRGCRV